MKKLMAFATVSLLMCTSYAQREKDVPAFGKVEKADLEMKTCDFDKDAEAVVLFDVAQLFGNSNSGTMDLDRHVRIKILNDKGFDEADIRLRYIGAKGEESIRNLQAQTYNLDASGNIVISKVEKKLIYEKKINKTRYEQVFTFPEVKAGCIIEYKYTHTNIGLVDWNFQEDIPVKYSRYQPDFPVEIEILATPMCLLPYDVKRESKGNREIQVFTMNNVPALRDEPYISCDKDYLQRVETRIRAYNFPGQPRQNRVFNWMQVIKALMDHEDFGVQLKRYIPRTSDLDSALKTLNDPYKKMVAVHNYVRSHMEWNGYDDLGAFDGVRAAWKDRKGTTGEINMILVNLLKEAGLDCKPLLASTRGNGRVNTGIAEINQFNKVLAHVTIGERVYILDATEKFTPSRLIPYDVMYSEALIINKLETYDWGWTVLWDDKQTFRDVVIIKADINESGQMKGEAVINSFDYSRVMNMPRIKKDQKEINDRFAVALPGIKIDDWKVENENNDSLPLIQKLNFNLPVNASGDYKYFTVNMFTGLEQNPFVADNRFSDVFFGANRSFSLVTNVTIPPGYVFEALPKNLRMIMPDTSISITRRIASEKNQMSARITLEFKKPVFSVEEYPEFKEFYKKLFDLLNEQIAIRKESNP